MFTLLCSIRQKWPLFLELDRHSELWFYWKRAAWTYSKMSVHLSSFGIFGGVVVSSDAQHIFSTVVELREAVELAVGEVDGRLVDSVQRCVGVVGAVEERLEQQTAAVEVSSASQVNSLVLRTHLILAVSWQTGVEDGRVCALSLMLTQQPRDSSDRWELPKEFWLTSNIHNINKSVKTKAF